MLPDDSLAETMIVNAAALQTTKFELAMNRASPINRTLIQVDPESTAA